MKTVLIMRHGKSSWNELGISDHDRPLKPRGKKDAPRIGQLLREVGLVPELILTSTARRASDTAELVAEGSGYDPDINYLPSFYHADLDSFYRKLKALPDDLQRVLVVGHNPDLEYLIDALADEDVTMKTATLVQVNLPLQHWYDLNEETDGQLIKVWYPRELH